MFEWFKEPQKQSLWETWRRLLQRCSRRTLQFCHRQWQLVYVDTGETILDLVYRVNLKLYQNSVASSWVLNQIGTYVDATTLKLCTSWLFSLAEILTLSWKLRSFIVSVNGRAVRHLYDQKSGEVFRSTGINWDLKPQVSRASEDLGIPKKWRLETAPFLQIVNLFHQIGIVLSNFFVWRSCKLSSFALV